jgi:hypothetical protein
MANESKTPEEYVTEALDLMVKAGWARQYAKNLKTGFLIDWTDYGKERIAFLSNALNELGTDNLSPPVWWAVETIAVFMRPL